MVDEQPDAVQRTKSYGGHLHAEKETCNARLRGQWTAIPRADSMKYLGVILDARLTFAKQVDAVMQKCRKRMGALRQLFGRKHRESKGAAYKAIVQPVVG